MTSVAPPIDIASRRQGQGRRASSTARGRRRGGMLLAAVIGAGAAGGLGWIGLEGVAVADSYLIVQGRAAESRLHPVQHAGGRIAQVHAVVGRPVAAGELLATVDPGDVDAKIGALKAEAENSQLRLDAVRREAQGFDVLQQQDLVARARVVALEHKLAQLEKENAEILVRIAEADSVLARVEIRSPIAGIVHSMAGLAAGRDVAPGEKLAEIVGNPGGIMLEAGLTAREARAVAAGRDVRIWPEPAAWADGRGFTGRLASVSPAAVRSASMGPDALTHIACVEVDAQQAAGLSAALSRPGAILRVSIRTGTGSAVQRLADTFRRLVLGNSSHLFSAGA